MNTASLAIVLSGVLFTSTAQADNSATFGDYTIHYNALPTNSLSPNVAKAYGIRRSGNRGMINIAVRKKLAGGSDVAVPAKVRAKMRNIHAQISSLDMQKIQEEKSIYYISDFKVDNAKPQRFNIEVIPEGSPLRKIEFSQTFYTE
jgi:hypothetical protein